MTHRSTSRCVPSFKRSRPSRPLRSSGLGADSIPGVHDLASREAPLGYWFWKAAWPGGGAIVDYIVRRERGEAELRVGTWDAGVAGPVSHDTSRTWNALGDGVVVDDAYISATGSHGA